MKLSVPLVLAFLFFAPQTWSAEVGKPAPDFTLADSKQENLHLDGLKGKVVYLDFWASWCGPCRETFPWMNQMHAKYAKEGLAIVAVNLDQRKEEMDRFLAKFPAEFTVVLDTQRKVGRLYGINALPMSFLIDREGVVRAHYLGAGKDHAQTAEAGIKSALETKQ
jgi:cytochrome c biogenesis protein CcmG, thiol:disulfide interchange protein DsbE